VRLTGGIVKHSRIRLVQNAPPGDLVGAVTGRLGSTRGSAIQIAERFSLVECQRRVPRRSSPR